MNQQISNHEHSSLDAERGVLSSLMLDRTCFGVVRGILEPNDFYDPRHEIVFKAISEILISGDSFDVVILSQKLEDSKLLARIGGRMYLAELMDAAPSASHAETYARIVKEKSTLRNVSRLSRDISSSNSLEAVSSKLMEAVSLVDYASKKDEMTFEEYVDQAIAEKDGTEEKGVETGVKFLDLMTKRLKAGHLWIIGGLYGSGKCHAKGEKILMYNGELKNVEDLQRGDFVMGVDSKPRKVMAVGGGRGELFKITPRFSEPFVVNGEHILSLACEWTQKNNGKKRTYREISVNEYIKQSKCYKRYHPLYSVPVEFPKQEELEVDPYFIGLWLGDGTSVDVSVTTMDQEIIDYLNSYAKELGLNVSTYLQRSGNCHRYAVVDQNRIYKNKEFTLQSKMRELNLISNKHIPQKYKTASRKDRLKLLAGLIDSDGSVCRNGRSGHINKPTGYEFGNCNEKLTDDVVFLARSLGLRARKVTRVSRIKSSGYECVSYRVFITGKCWEIPTLVKRKQLTESVRRVAADTQSFTVEPIGVGDFYGFELDGDHLYMIGNFTVHHNSKLCMQISHSVAKQHKIFYYSLDESGVDIVDFYLRKNEQTMDREKSIAEVRALAPRISIFENKLSLAKIAAHLLSINEKERPKVVFLDYVQLVETDDQKEYDRISRVARGLKVLAKVAGVCFVCISQVSQAGYTDKTRRINLKGSGEVASAANVVLLLERDDDEAPEDDVVNFYCKLKKNRGGREGNVTWQFDKTRNEIIFASKNSREDYILKESKKYVKKQTQDLGLPNF